MKKMILLVLLASLNASAATEKLLEYFQGGGLFANFSSRVLTIDVDGKVVIEKKTFNDKSEVVELAQLSKSALENENPYFYTCYFDTFFKYDSMLKKREQIKRNS